MTQRCPPELGREIVLTGSVSRGVADDCSDIEQVFYVDTLPSPDERARWLHRLGATHIMHDSDPIEDSSIWSTFLFQEIWVETGWQSLSVHEENLRTILAGEVLEHGKLTLAEVIGHAVPLRSDGFLSKWQQQLASYPPILIPKLIRSATELWAFPHIIDARWTLAQRNERHALAGRLVADTYNVLRILFALNQQWEPDWKWLQYATRSLGCKPERLFERINSMLFLSTPQQSITTCLQLMRDTLLLVPAPYDTSQALTNIQQSQAKHGAQ
jgi:hypothetical protein